MRNYPLSHALPYRHRATKSKMLNEVASKARLCRRTPLNMQFACWEAQKRGSGPLSTRNLRVGRLRNAVRGSFWTPLSTQFACWEAPQMMSLFQGASQHAISVLRGVLSFFSREKYHNISNSLILATHSIKTSATSFSADPSRFRFLSALMSECRQMKMNKCFWHFLVFGDLTGRPSGKKFAMSKDQKIMWERNNTVKRIK